MTYEREWDQLRLESSRSESRDLPLFASPQVRKLARRSDRTTSKEAAMSVVDRLTAIQSKVLKAFERHGPMGARTLERLSEFSGYGYSTASKRLYELAERGLLSETSQREGRCSVYRLASASTLTWAA